MFEHRLTRRGVFLWVMSILQGLIGWSTLDAPPIVFKDLALISEITPLFWGWVQISLAFVMAFFAVTRAGLDRFGFMAAYIMPFVWGSSYLVTTIHGDYPLGAVAGVRSVAVWYGYCAMIMIVSGMIGLEKYPHEGDTHGPA